MVEPPCPFAALSGRHPRLLAAIARARAAAPTPATVLVLGETGTGKSLLASAIHQASGRRGRFVALNCGALPDGLLESELFGHERGAFTGATARREGKFEAAAGGTLFLDEVDTLGPGAQAALLRVLQERRLELVGSNEAIDVDVRIVAASNRDLAVESAAGRFRKDLYFRLDVVPIVLPPLRDRPDDVEALALHFLRKHAGPMGRTDCRSIAPIVMDALRSQPWPGNARELENTILRAIVFADGPSLDRIDLGPGAPTDEATCIDAEGPLQDARRRALDAAESSYLRAVLSRAGGDVDRAARHAQLSRRMFYLLLRRHGIRAGDYRSAKEAPRCSA